MFSSCVVLNPCDGGTTKKSILVTTIKMYRIQCLNPTFLQNFLFCVLQIKGSCTGLQQYDVNDDRKMM